MAALQQHKQRENPKEGMAKWPKRHIKRQVLYTPEQPAIPRRSNVNSTEYQEENN